MKHTPIALWGISLKVGSMETIKSAQTQKDAEHAAAEEILKSIDEKQLRIAFLMLNEFKTWVLRKYLRMVFCWKLMKYKSLTIISRNVLFSERDLVHYYGTCSGETQYINRSFFTTPHGNCI